MKLQALCLATLALFATATLAHAEDSVQATSAKATSSTQATGSTKATGSAKATGTSRVDLFDAMDSGQVDVKFIAKSASRGRMIIENKTDQPVNLQIPEAFAGVPVLAQFGGGGGQGGGGFGGGGGGGGQQAVGGGGGGLGGGGGGLGGGGGGQFSIPPEKTSRIDVPLLCLEHGKKDPSSSKPYKLVRVEKVVKSPAVIELLKAYGNGQLRPEAAQAAVWHLNNNLTWQQLAAKLGGTNRDINRPAYFSRAALQLAVNYANESHRLAKANADKYRSLADKASHESMSEETSYNAKPEDETETVKQEETADKTDATKVGEAS